MAAFVFFLTSATIASGNCPCPEVCGPCQGGIIKLTLVFTGEEPAYIEGRDMTTRLFGANVVPGDTIRLTGSLPNLRFRGNELTMIIDGVGEPTIEVSCSTIEIFKRIGSFMMIGAESSVGGPVCCPAVIIHDEFGPEFLSRPEDIVVDVAGGCEALVNWTNPDATDCSAFTITSDPEPGSVLPVGETTVIVTATDARNNKTTTSFKIYVRDVAPPVFTYCPDDIAITTTNSLGALADWELPRATDNCGEVNLESTVSPNQRFAPGVHSVTYTARDVAGNSSTCVFEITIHYERPDGEPLPIEELKVSKIISPDGDGINDFLKITNIERYPSNKVVIFDRWGNSVFVCENYDNVNNVWHGTGGNAGRLPTGTYFFSLVIHSGNQKSELKGFVELIN